MKPTIKRIRAAVADYICSEGCDCCSGSDHKLHKEALGRMLRMKKYPDGSGYDFYRYSPKKERKR